jgi:hypothetical protein
LKLRFLVIFCLLASVPTVYSQSKRPIYSISGGVALPSQPAVLNELWNGGWHIGGGIGYPVTPWLNIGGAFSYSHLPFDAKAVIARSKLASYYPWVRVEGNSATIITGNCRVKINLTVPTRTSWFSPYFFGGMGWYRLTLGEYALKFRIVTEESERTDRHLEYPCSQVGLEGGAGFEVYLTKHLNGFAEITYCSSFTDSPIWAEWIPLRIGLLLH